MTTKAFIRKYVPVGSYIDRYMQMCDPLETPLAYDFWCALWVMSSVIGRDVIVARPSTPVFLNWYIILTASSGVTRKSTAVRMARDVLRAMDMPVFEGRATTEYLWDRLSETDEARMSIAVSELVTFLGKSSGAVELPGLLTDLYDCPTSRDGGGTVERGSRRLNNAYVTFLSASTPAWLQQAINPAVIEGGFSSRCMFVSADAPKKKVAWPTETCDNAAVVEALRELQVTVSQYKEITPTPGAVKQFSSWYNRRINASHDPFLGSFYTREDGHLLRAAAMLAINDGTYAIYPKHITAATTLMSEVRSAGVELFRDRGNTPKLNLGWQRMCEICMEAGNAGIMHSQLYLRLRHMLPSEQINVMTHFAVQNGLLHVEEVDRSRPGRTPRRYIRTNLMADMRRREEVRKLLLLG